MSEIKNEISYVLCIILSTKSYLFVSRNFKLQNQGCKQIQFCSLHRAQRESKITQTFELLFFFKSNLPCNLFKMNIIIMPRYYRKIYNSETI